MADDTENQLADRYEFTSTDQDVTGSITVASGSGSNRTLTVDGIAASDIEVEGLAMGGHVLGWAVSGYLDAIPDLHSRSIAVLLPRVNADSVVESFNGVAMVITHHTSIGGPSLVKGALQEYDVRKIAGTARRHQP